MRKIISSNEFIAKLKDLGIVAKVPVAHVVIEAEANMPLKIFVQGFPGEGILQVLDKLESLPEGDVMAVDVPEVVSGTIARQGGV